MDDCDNDLKESVTLSDNKHEPCGFFYLYQIFIWWIKKLKLFYGISSCTKWHAQEIINLSETVLPLTTEELQSHNSRKVYYICVEKIGCHNQYLKKVKNYCHFTGKY